MLRALLDLGHVVGQVAVLALFAGVVLMWAAWQWRLWDHRHHPRPEPVEPPADLSTLDRLDGVRDVG